MQPSRSGKLFNYGFATRIKAAIVRAIATKNGPRAVLNKYYGLLGWEAKFHFHARYSKIFSDQTIPPTSGEWNIYFAGQKVRLPLRSSSFWLDWNSAVSVVGHDIEIKQTYAALVSSDQRPALFLDVGANYGTHSVLFLSVGVPIIAFEPNPTCFSYFQAVCELNGLKGRWEQVAIGNKTGPIELAYLEKATWLGSVSSDVVSTLKKSADVRAVKVTIKKLDCYLSDVPYDKALIKIDVEGSEREVIEGASQLLQQRKPKLIFESNDTKSRHGLFHVLADHRYSIHVLPWRPSATSHILSVNEFLGSTATNFIAIPDAV